MGNRCDTISAPRVTIRSALGSDTSAYLALLRQVDRESEFLAWEPSERQLDPETLRSRLAQRDTSTGLRVLAVDRQRPVGFLVSHRPAPRRLRHRADFTIAVARDFQGRGIGRRLLGALDEWAVEHGIARLELTVMAHNRRAIALYRRAGYVEEGTKRGSIRIDGRAIDEIVMAKVTSGSRSS